LQCATFPLKPLALHEKVATAIRFEKRAVTSLKISGDFSLPDIHQVTRSAVLSFLVTLPVYICIDSPWSIQLNSSFLAIPLFLSVVFSFFPGRTRSGRPTCCPSCRRV
jgi:hypothetical protein